MLHYIYDYAVTHLNIAQLENFTKRLAKVHNNTEDISTHLKYPLSASLKLEINFSSIPLRKQPFVTIIVTCQIWNMK